MVIIAIINGSIRQSIYETFLDELSAHQLSVITGIIFFAIYIWFISGKWKIKSGKEAFLIGLMWLVMTVLFEFVFGYFVIGNSFEELLLDYNVLKGRLWIGILIWITISPIIFYNYHSSNKK
jgi:hypothetical protein